MFLRNLKWPNLGRSYQRLKTIRWKYSACATQ